ncbi:MAG: sigma-54-dependent Fis family transcriptional regulator [Elusimicrobia bacterium]|nr:sigma-54-dependent Fis family transcriptional regulator [Elusimicrobiota bacterium]
MKKSQSKKERILVVDDAKDTLELVQRNLSGKGYEVFTALSVEIAIDILNKIPVDLVITDLKMPGSGGLELVRYVRENFRETEVMMITGYATIQGAVKAVKIGAEDYLAKPFTDVELFSAVERALSKLHLRKTSTKYSKHPAVFPHGLVGESKAMHRIYKDIVKTAATRSTVLISGESGTGKELVARAIHYGSRQSSSPFIPVNCAGIPEDLFESELFGYLKGAFTGANESRAGFFQASDGGTIFLDEISEISPSAQVKLLRVLQDKEIYMVGSRKPLKIDVRIIAATNKNLLDFVKKGAFREDLYFRINVITMEIPPLREREDDVLLLISHFAAKFAKELGKKLPKFSDRALEIIKNYRWPGNVMEIENVIHRLVVMSESEVIDVSDLPSLMRLCELHGTGFNKTLKEVEAEHVRNVLSFTKGNKTETARILGIDRKTLRTHLKTHSI